MKTAEEFIKENLWYAKHSMRAYLEKDDVIETIERLGDVLKAYAQAAIEEDRKNIAEHAKTKGLYHRSIDKDSIINAPQIELK